MLSTLASTTFGGNRSSGSVPETPKTQAQVELEGAWFDAIESLRASTQFGGDKERILASGKILDYCIAMGQSINEPFLPTGERPPDEDSDDDD